MTSKANKSGAVKASRRRFWSDRSGNVAMLLGLAAIPFFAMGGMAVDYSRALMVKNRLSEALDATALALGSQPGLSDTQVQTTATNYFNANYSVGNVGSPSSLNIQTTTATVDITASASVPTLVLGLIGFNTIPVESHVQVTRQNKGIELAMVLDTTGSMAQSGKIAALKDAAHTLVNILFGTDSNSPLVKIGVVPFAAAIKLDPTTAINNGWIDKTGMSPTAKLNFSSRFAYQIYAPNSGVPNVTYQMTRKWAGCVEARTYKTGSSPWDLEATDTAPTTAATPTAVQARSLWVPFFSPDEPDSGSSGWVNNWTSDLLVGSGYTWQQRLQNSVKYAAVNKSDVEDQCAMQPVLALTNDRTSIEAKIDALNPSGNTHIPIGLGWGWRVLSPGEPFTEGVAYNDPDWFKALILMTDGDNTIATDSSPAGSGYSAYGYLYQARLGSTSASTAVTNMNAETTTLCNSIKGAGIRLYTILLMENDPTVHSMLQNCATDPNTMFFDTPSADQLQPVFQQIATDLSNLRISQ